MEGISGVMVPNHSRYSDEYLQLGEMVRLIVYGFFPHLSMNLQEESICYC